MQGLKEKVTELETELRATQEENARLQKLGERFESMKGVITRKDGIIQTLKMQVEKLQLQIDAQTSREQQQQAEADKRAK